MLVASSSQGPRFFLEPSVPTRTALLAGGLLMSLPSAMAVPLAPALAGQWGRWPLAGANQVRVCAGKCAIVRPRTLGMMAVAVQAVVSVVARSIAYIDLSHCGAIA